MGTTYNRLRGSKFQSSSHFICLVPWDLKATRNTSSRGINISYCGLPRAFIPGCLELSSQVASSSQGTNFETKIFNFRWFLALPTETSFTTPHYYPKYEVWAIEIFWW